MTVNKQIATITAKLTEEIIEQLKQGVVPWTQPWESGLQSISPMNAKTGAEYTATNWLLLNAVAEKRAYTSNQWLTFHQAKSCGGMVKKGQKGAKIIVCKPAKVTREVDDVKTGEVVEIENSYMSIKYYTVFALEQIDGVNTDEIAQYDNSRHGTADKFIVNSKAKIEHIGQKAYFSPSDDLINMPKLETFHTSENYYAALLHELVHWTGHESRLNRQYRDLKSKKDYAREELVAELGAAFLCSMLGIKGKLQHAEYIGHWVDILQEDHRAIVRAASAAQKAVTYLTEL